VAGPGERRVSATIIGAAVVVFLALYLVQPPSFETPDEAKYIGLGLNILEGRGLVTDFGVRFLLHPPLWPIVLAAGPHWLGLDALSVAHVLEAAFAAGLVLLAASLAWRVRPAAGALAATILLATPYLATLARTAGIDIPAAVFSLGYLAVASRAYARGSIRLGLLAGVLFGIAFLIKETVIPFAPIPFVAAVLGPRPGAVVARVTAATLLSASLLVGPWFVLFASFTGTIYRAGGPAWLLGPLAILDGLAIALGLAAPALARALASRQRPGPATAGQAARGRRWLGWAILFAWLGGQLIVYSRAAKLGGESLFHLRQLLHAGIYLPQLGGIVGFGLVGLVLAIACARRRPDVPELVAATVAQAPLIVLVLAIGETPRHYVATLALFAALGAVGWLEAFDRAVTPRARATFLAAVLVAFLPAFPQLGKAALPMAAVALVALALATWKLAGPPVGAAGAAPSARDVGGTPPARGLVAGLAASPLAAGLLAVFVLAGALAGVTAFRASRLTSSGSAESAAIAAISTWVRASQPPGARIIVGEQLAYEIALATHGHDSVIRVRPESAQVDASAPLGLRSVGAGPILDPATIESALRLVDHVDVYAAASVEQVVRTEQPAAWIVATFVGPDDTTSPVIAAFDAATGSHRAASWSFAYTNHRLLVVAFELDPATFALSSSAFAGRLGIDVVADGLAAAAGGSTAASALLARLVPVPAGGEAVDAAQRLRRVSEGLPPGGG